MRTEAGGLKKPWRGARFAALIMLVAFLALPAKGQTNVRVTSGSALPAGCDSQSNMALFLLTSGVAGSASLGNSSGANGPGLYYCTSLGTWKSTSATSSSGALPSGMEALIFSGTCPTGFTEDDSLNGQILEGTTHAAGNVGSTGGSNSITPTGSNSGGAFAEGAILWPLTVPTIAAGNFTQPAVSWPAGVPTFAGAQGTTSSVGAGTPAGTNASGAFTEGAISYPANVPSFAGAALTATTFSIATGSGSFKGTNAGGFSTVGGAAPGSTGTTTSKSPGTPAGTIAWPADPPTIAAGTFTQPTFTGSALAGHTHTLTPTGTVAWPAGVPTNAGGAFDEGAISWPGSAPSIAAGTFTQPGFTGNAFDPHPAFTRVIFCKAN